MALMFLNGDGMRDVPMDKLRELLASEPPELELSIIEHLVQADGPAGGQR